MTTNHPTQPNDGPTTLEYTLGESNTLKILEFLLRAPTDFTQATISLTTKLGRTATRNALRKLTQTGIVTKTRKELRSQYYAINKEDIRYPALIKLYESIQEEIKKKWKQKSEHHQ